MAYWRRMTGLIRATAYSPVHLYINTRMVPTGPTELMVLTELTAPTELLSTIPTISTDRKTKSIEKVICQTF